MGCNGHLEEREVFKGGANGDIHAKPIAGVDAWREGGLLRTCQAGK
jgi:hypothetical protein